MATTTFASVKLPGSLVEQARQAAQPMRRSVASQIEYWATLGQIVEHTGLSVQEARSAIAQLGGAVEDVTDYTIPGTEVTHRVVRIRKERPTPAGFPRAFARIKKAPLR